jgi:hypothetical protein
VSSPSTHANQLNQQKTNEKGLSPKWHSSYAPLATINIWIKDPSSLGNFDCAETDFRRPLAPLFLNRISRTESIFYPQLKSIEYFAGTAQ